MENNYIFVYFWLPHKFNQSPQLVTTYFRLERLRFFFIIYYVVFYLIFFYSWRILELTTDLNSVPTMYTPHIPNTLRVAYPNHTTHEENCKLGDYDIKITPFLLVYYYYYKQDCKSTDKGYSFYEFRRNSRSVKSTILHFQVSFNLYLLCFL
jgi:hypothetical protein